MTTPSPEQKLIDALEQAVRDFFPCGDPVDRIILTKLQDAIPIARSLLAELTKYTARWNYIKEDIDGARALLLLLKQDKGTPDDFDTMVDRIIESRNAAKARSNK